MALGVSFLEVINGSKSWLQRSEARQGTSTIPECAQNEAMPIPHDTVLQVVPVITQRGLQKGMYARRAVCDVQTARSQWKSPSQGGDTSAPSFLKKTQLQHHDTSY